MRRHPLHRLQGAPWGELAGPALITLLVLYYYGRLLTGEFPVSHDHPAHMFNAWLTADVLIPRGELGGWSELWFAGYPANELYGPGGNLWVTLFRYLTFGLLSFGATYGLAVFALMWLVPISAYVLGRAFLGRAAGAIAGLLLVVTRGGWYDLGYFWILEMGVWPFALGAALTLLSIVVLRRYLVRGGPRGLVLAALSLAVAVLGHPMSLLLLVIAAPMVVLHVVLERGRAGSTRLLVRAAAAAIFGALLAAFWLVPFVTKSAYSQKLGEVWLELRDAMPAVVQMDLFGNEWRVIMGMALVGLVIAMFRRHVWAIYLATTGALMALFASSTLLYELRLFDVLSPLAAIQYPRFLGVVRIFVYLLAGYGIAEVARFAAPSLKQLKDATAGERIRAAVLVALPLCLSIPFWSGAGEYIEEHHYPKDEVVRTQRDITWWPDYLAAAEYVKEQLDGQPFSRVGAFGHPYDHILSTLPIYTGLPVYTGGFLPAHTYRYFFDGHRDLSTLRAVGVRYVLATGDWAKDKPGVTERAVFGSLTVYELEGTPAGRASAVGDCAVEVTSADDRSMAIAVTDAQAPCRIRLHRSDFPNWRADFDGEPLAIERIPLFQGSDYAAFMSVVAPRDGTVTLTWASTDGDRLGVALSGVGWTLFLVLGLLAIRRRWWDRLLAALPRPAPAVQRWAARTAWAGLAAVLIGGVVWGAQRTQEVHYTFDRHLDDAEKTVEQDGKHLECPPAEKGLGWQCGKGWDRIRAGLFSYVYDNRYCIYAHPSPIGPKRLVFRDVPLGARLSGFYGVLDSSQGRGDVTMAVQVGDATPVTFTTAKNGEAVGFELMTEPVPDDVTVTITAARPEWRHFCFNMQVLD